MDLQLQTLNHLRLDLVKYHLYNSTDIVLQYEKGFLNKERFDLNRRESVLSAKSLWGK